jgi:hypothetical protein
LTRKRDAVRPYPFENIKWGRIFFFFYFSAGGRHCDRQMAGTKNNGEGQWRGRATGRGKLFPRKLAVLASFAGTTFYVCRSSRFIDPAIRCPSNSSQRTINMPSTFSLIAIIFSSTHPTSCTHSETGRQTHARTYTHAQTAPWSRVWR